MATPYYIQTASLHGPDATHKVNFTNLSSQQLNPGHLVDFFVKSDNMRPMPYTDGDIPTDRSEVAHQLSEWNNVSNLSRKNELPEYFRSENTPRDAHYRTPEQRMWRVPEHLLDARATELF